MSDVYYGQTRTGARPFFLAGAKGLTRPGYCSIVVLMTKVSDQKIAKAARTALTQCLGVKSGERLLIVTNPNPTTTPQRKLAEVQRWCTERGWWGKRVRCIDWVAADRRFDRIA